MNNNKEIISGYTAEDVARINAIDLSDPKRIAAINAIDNTVSKPNSNIQYVKVALQTVYGRVRWVDYSDPDYENDGHRELEQEVTTFYIDGRVESKWVVVPTK